MYTPLALASGGSSVTKRILLASTLLFPASATGRAVGAWLGRQAVVRTGTVLQGMLMDPMGMHRHLSSALTTYKRGSDIVGAYNYFNKYRNYKSSGSSSRAYQQNGSPGGTNPISSRAALFAGNVAISALSRRNWTSKEWTAHRKRACPKGYVPNYDRLGRRRGCKKISKSRCKK